MPRFCFTCRAAGRSPGKTGHVATAGGRSFAVSQRENARDNERSAVVAREIGTPQGINEIAEVYSATKRHASGECRPGILRRNNDPDVSPILKRCELTFTH